MLNLLRFHLLLALLSVYTSCLMANHTQQNRVADQSIQAASSGDSLLISERYEQVPVRDILQDLSQKYNFSLYLQADSLLSEEISIAFENELLELALDRLLSQTPLGFMRYRSYLVIVAPRERLEQFYTPAYYQTLARRTVATPEAAEVETPMVFEIGNAESISPDGEGQLVGTVRDADNGEPIIGATVYFPELELGTSTDVDGSFAVELPIGQHELTLSYLGYASLTAPITVFNDGALSFTLNKVGIDLEEVVVEAEAADANVSSAEIGVARLTTEQIRKLPSFMGEVDVLNSLLQEPGVSSVGEGAGGFNVRGGNVDQNLVLMDEQFMFNPTHALGFFSAFNPDLVNSVELYKGYMPAEYGGRLASVLDVEMRDGDPNNFRMRGGIGMVATRLSAEGPVIKDKSSFIGGFRTTYSDWVLGLINVPEVQRSSVTFYDANLRYTHRFNENNQIILSGYSTRDNTVFNDEFGFEYSTNGGQISYKKVINPQLLSTFSVTASQYEAIGRELRDSVTSAQLTTRYQYLKVKEILSYNPDEDLSIQGGFSGVFYRIAPGDRAPFGDLSTVVPIALGEEQALESALFVQSDWSPSPLLSLSGGLRLVRYQALGPGSYFNYEDPEAPTEATITGETTVSGTETIAEYYSLEPRLGMRYSLNAISSVKAGYSRTGQFINQLANLISPTPVSIWQLSNQYVQPQRAHSFSLGYFRNFQRNAWETSLEGYYRYVDQLTDFKDFAELSANPGIETELLYGIGRAYGLEASIRKKKGILTGWINYTFSRTLQQVEGINDGDWYPAHFDKPHNLTITTNWQPSGRITMAMNFNYSTGRPITAPVGRSTAAGKFPVLEYSGRNQVRIPDYHRLDFAFTMDGNYKKNQRFKTSWTLAVNNIYGRRNPYSVFFRPSGGRLPETTRLAVLGTAFVSLTLNFDFK